MNQLAKQLLLLISITTVLTWALFAINVPLVLAIILSFIIQYAAYNGFVYAVDAYALVKTKQLEVKKLEYIDSQGTEVVCPCGKQTKEFIPIRLNRPNYYKCNTCAKTLAAFVGVETAIVTEPIGNTDINSIDGMLNNKLNELTR